MKILNSFNNHGAEAAFWQREFATASDAEYTFIPFNHDPYLDQNLYLRALRLGDLYYDRHPGLMRMYVEDGASKRSGH